MNNSFRNKRSRLNQSQRKRRDYSRSSHGRGNGRKGTNCEFQILGDDWFFDLARTMLQTPARRDAGTGRCYAGMCQTGMTLENACKMIQRRQFTSNVRIIVLIGTTDILMGRSYYDIIRDYEVLMETFSELPVTPFFCTIPPIAEKMYIPSVKNALNHVNEFIKKTADVCIDLHALFVGPTGGCNFDMYQTYCKFISGFRKLSLAHWNYQAKATVLNFLKACVVSYNRPLPTNP